MELQAFEMEQNGIRFYITYMTALQLVKEDKIKVDTFKHEDESGYQREVSDSRSEEFAKYIMNSKGFSPLSILLNVRTKISFKRKDENYGTLTVPPDATFWIVDGQHRRVGLRYLLQEMPEYENYKVPVIITNLDKVSEEAKQFLIINKTQKGVRSDLAERFLSKLFDDPEKIVSQLPSSVIKGITWIPRAIEVAENLNKDKNSVWYRKIRFPNEPKLITLVSQKSFTESLKPIVRNDMFDLYSAEEISELLVRYWSAIKEVMPVAFDRPEEHFVQKTAGIFTLHKLFPLVISYCGNTPTVSRMKEILSRMSHGMNANYWNKTGEVGLAGTSQKSFYIIHRKLAMYLEEGNKHKADSKKRPFEL